MSTRTIILHEEKAYDQVRSNWTATVRIAPGHGSVEAGYFSTPEAALEWAVKQG